MLDNMQNSDFEMNHTDETERRIPTIVRRQDSFSLDEPIVSSVGRPTMPSIERPAMSETDAPVIPSIVRRQQEPLMEELAMEMPAVERPVMSSIERPTMPSIERPVMSETDAPVIPSIERPAMSPVEPPEEKPVTPSVARAAASSASGVGKLQELERAARRKLEQAREAESQAYAAMDRAVLGRSEHSAAELVALQESAETGEDFLERKCIALLNGYCLPHLLQEGESFQLDAQFTKFDDPDKKYIRAVFKKASGEEREVCYNYKADRDGKSLLIFEKVFEDLELTPAELGKYLIYEEDGETVKYEYSLPDLKNKMAAGEVVKLEDTYYLKDTDENGEVIEGVKNVFVTESDLGGVRTVLGHKEEKVYSQNNIGQLVESVSNDVTTIAYATRNLMGSPAVFASEQEARAAAAKELQPGEVNLKVNTVVDGRFKASLNFLSTVVTTVDLTGITRKVGKGHGEYDSSLDGIGNLKKQLEAVVRQNLEEKYYHVMNIFYTDNFATEYTETIGFMNTVENHTITSGQMIIEYMKVNKAPITVKQGFLGRGQDGEHYIANALAQLPAGSELINPEKIDWKSAKQLDVLYVVRNEVSAGGSGRTLEEARAATAENVLLEAQKIAARGINGGVTSSIKECLAAKGDILTVAGVKKQIYGPQVTVDQLEVTNEDVKYGYTGTCEQETATTVNRVVSMTTWNCKPIVYEGAQDAVVEKDCPTDRNYIKFMEEDDDSGIILFEKTDIGLRKYLAGIRESKTLAEQTRKDYEEAEKALNEAQEEFNRIRTMRKELEA